MTHKFVSRVFVQQLSHLACNDMRQNISVKMYISYEDVWRESNVETYITVCKIESQWEFTVWLRKLKQGLCIN